MDRKFILIVILLMAAEITSAFESSMVLVGLQHWIAIYKDPVAVGWLVTSYLLIASSSAAICGRLGDVYGRKRLLMIVLGGCLSGSLVSAMAPSLGWMIMGRSVQGLAGAIIPLCYGLAREHLPKQQVPSAIGMIVAVASIGTVTGMLVGGILVDHFDPQSIFWASSGLALVSAASIALFMPNSTGQARTARLDILGGVLFAPAIGLLLYGLGEGGGSAGWSNWTTWLILGGGAALLFVWTLHELRQSDPLIDVRLFANRHILLANLVLACLAVGAFQFTQLMSMLLQQPVSTGIGLGVSATFVGVLRLPSIVTGAASSGWAGWASGRYGGRVPILIGCAVVACAMVAACIDHSRVEVIFVVAIISGMGVAAAYAGVPNVIIAATPPDRTSETTGLMAVVRAVSRAVGAQLLVLILATSTLKDQSGVSYPDGTAYTRVLLMMGGLAVLAVFLTMLLPKGERRERKAATAEGTLEPA